MRCVLLHYHIFKNAGSTIEEMLERSFRGAFSRIETPDREGLVSNQDLLHFLKQNPSIKAISSHQLRYPTPRFPGFLFLDICLLRDPIDRIRSIYDFYHSHPATGDPLSDLAQGSLGYFVAGLVEQQPLYIRNVQVNQLACGGDSDEPEGKDLLVATERIRSAAFLGVLDCFNKGMVAAEHRLQPVFPELDCALPAENVTGGLEGSLAQRIEKVRAACDESVYAELLRWNELDIRLLDCARAEVERRFRLVPDACAKLQEFEQRISQPPGKRVGRCPRSQEQPTPTRTEGAITASAPFPKPNWFTKLRRLTAVPLDAFTLWLSSRRYGTDLFDPQYYRATYTEIGAGTNPLLHYLLRGAFELKKPHPLFDPAFYKKKYPDVAGANPLGHYLRHAHRQPTPFFDPAFYLEHNPDVRETRIPPLLHYVSHGAGEGRKPHPLFQPEYYARSGAGIQVGPSGFLAHFAASGADACNPHPLFDCKSYLSKYPEVAADDINPLAHYLSLEPGKRIQTIVKSDPGMGFAVAEFEIADVPLAVVFQGDDLPRGQKPPSAGVVLITKHQSGTITIQAEPQQQPFFQAIPFEQLYAQVRA
ncbi:MAG TPA: hypothetical protein VH640_21005 [Bryobacteraceae bacterium]|jgi:hypothetical protein